MPFIGDRLDEAFRQHNEFIRDELSRYPSDIFRKQVSPRSSTIPPPCSRWPT